MADLSLQEVLRLISSGEIQKHLDLCTPINILWMLGMMAAADDTWFRNDPWYRMLRAHVTCNRVKCSQKFFPFRYLLPDGRIETFKKGGSDKQSLAELYRNIKGHTSQMHNN